MYVHCTTYHKLDFDCSFLLSSLIVSLTLVYSNQHTTRSTFTPTYYYFTSHHTGGGGGGGGEYIIGYK